VVAYFGALGIWNAVADSEAGVMAAAIAIGKSMVLGALCLGLLCLLAWLSARTTLYVVTSRRIVMKVGIALPIFFNIPYSQIASAALRRFNDGTGEIPLALAPGRRIALLHLWPHSRPLHVANPQPALRSIADASEVAETLRQANGRRKAAGRLATLSPQGVPSRPDSPLRTAPPSWDARLAGAANPNRVRRAAVAA
jgi:hypothetical protein